MTGFVRIQPNSRRLPESSPLIKQFRVEYVEYQTPACFMFSRPSARFRRVSERLTSLAAWILELWLCQPALHLEERLWFYHAGSPIEIEGIFTALVHLTPLVKVDSLILHSTTNRQSEEILESATDP